MRTSKITIVITACVVSLILLTQITSAAENERQSGKRGTRPERSGQKQFNDQDRPEFDQRPERGPRQKGDVLEMLTEKLDLSEGQQAIIKNIKESNKQQVEAAHKTAKELTQKLRETAMSGATAQEIRSIAAQLGSAMGETAVLRANSFNAVKKALTKEQLTKLDEIIAQHKERMQGPEARQQLRREHEGQDGDAENSNSQGRKGNRPNPAKMIERKDTNADGKLSMDEFTAGKNADPERAQGFFDKFDTDKDGYITAEELEKAGPRKHRERNQ